MTIIADLDELANRAANDPSLSNAGLDRVIVAVIKRTRRHWEAMPDPYVAGEAAQTPASESKDSRES